MGLFTGKTKKQIVDKNGIATSRWVSDEAKSLGKTRILPRPAYPSLSTEYKFRDVDGEHAKWEQKRKLQEAQRVRYIEGTQPVETTEDAKILWLALHINQGGNVKSTGYGLGNLETPTVDSKIDFPVGYGSAAVESLVIEALTPNINLKGASGDRRRGWEHGHGTVYALKSNNGILVAETNKDGDVGATSKEIAAAKALSHNDMVALANRVYADHGVEEKATEVLGALYRFRKTEAPPKANSGFASRPDSARSNGRGFSPVSEAGGKVPIRQREDDYESSLDRAVKDPLGITDPYGVRDPAAAFIRDAMGTGGFGSGGFGSD